MNTYVATYIFSLRNGKNVPVKKRIEASSIEEATELAKDNVLNDMQFYIESRDLFTFKKVEDFVFQVGCIETFWFDSIEEEI